MRHDSPASPPFELDQFGFARAHLTEEALAVLRNLDDVLERDVLPLLTQDVEAPDIARRVLDAIVPLSLMTPPELTEEEASSHLFGGWRNYVLARRDASVATLYNAQSGLFRAAVKHGGSAEQYAILEPEITSFRSFGTFALTEPEHGSDVARGLATSATFENGSWVLSGAKRWIGAANLADLIAVFARDQEGGVRGFLVPAGTEGISIVTMTGKTSLRLMPNTEVRLDKVRVPDSARLERVEQWRDVARILRAARSDVAWIATGLQAGSLAAAIRYTTERTQFGRPIAGFQLVQEKLARMAGNLASSLGIVTRLAANQDAGHYSDEESALAKMQTARLARETVALGREVAGGNGILLEHDVARFFVDAEAVYSYEGTHEINALIVGRGLTGISAFV